MLHGGYPISVPISACFMAMVSCAHHLCAVASVPRENRVISVHPENTINVVAGAEELPAYEAAREPGLAPATTAKLRAALSHAHRLRFPLSCGGSLEHLRFAGLFSQNQSHWRAPPLAARRIDVGAYVVAGDTNPDGTLFLNPKAALAPDAAALLERQRARLRTALRALRRARPGTAVRADSGGLPSYAALIAVLLDTKARPSARSQ